MIAPRPCVVLPFGDWASMRARWRQRGLVIEVDRMLRELAWTMALERLWRLWP